MTAQSSPVTPELTARPPRFGGAFLRISRLTTSGTMLLAGKGWNPVFSVVEHRGRRTGRQYATPVAARRIDDGFIIALAFGAHVDWYRNLVAAGGGTIRWRDAPYPVSAPEPIDASVARAAFLPIQRLLMWLGRIDGFIRVRDTSVAA